MSDSQRFLEGAIEEPATNPLVLELEAEIRALRRELAEARAESIRAKRNAEAALSALRKQLSPLHRALQAVFGELDAVGIEEPASATPHVSVVWESWKDRLGRGTASARVIEALQSHGELNVAQLKVAAKMATGTAYDAVEKLVKLGLLTKNGGKFSLKTL